MIYMIIGIALLCLSLLWMCMTATPSNKEQYEANQRYKERQKKHGKSIR